MSQGEIYAGVVINKSLTEYTPACFKSRVLTPRDIVFFEEIDTYGSLNLARQRAETAPKWELFRTWEVDADEFEQYTRAILRQNAQAHTMGQSVLSKPEHEFVDGQEFLSRLNFTRPRIEFSRRRAKILPTAVQKLLAKELKKIEVDRKRLKDLEDAA